MPEVAALPDQGRSRLAVLISGKFDSSCTKVRGAGMFIGILRNKLTAAGGEMIEFATRTTCRSQFDHVDGTFTKKPLSQRYHQLPDRTRVRRDLYSAFLARFVCEDRRYARRAA